MKKKNSFNLIRGFSFALLWMISLCAVAQNITVSGTVYDTNGEPLVGVTILVQGTSVGTVTDMDGNFTLTNVDPNATLEASYVGMTTQTVAVDGRTSLNITLEEDAEILEELVVIGYQTIRKADLTGAVSV